MHFVFALCVIIFVFALVREVKRDVPLKNCCSVARHVPLFRWDDNSRVTFVSTKLRHKLQD